MTCLQLANQIGLLFSSTTVPMPQLGCFIIQLPRRVLRVYWLGYLPGSVFQEQAPSCVPALMCTCACVAMHWSSWLGCRDKSDDDDVFQDDAGKYIISFVKRSTIVAKEVVFGSQLRPYAPKIVLVGGRTISTLEPFSR